MNQAYEPLCFDAFIGLEPTLIISVERTEVKDGVEIGLSRRFFGTEDAI